MPYLWDVEEMVHSLSLVYVKLQKFGKKLEENLSIYLDYLESVKKFQNEIRFETGTMKVLTKKDRRFFAKEGMITRKVLAVSGETSSFEFQESHLQQQVDLNQHQSLEGAGASWYRPLWRECENERTVVVQVGLFVLRGNSADWLSASCLQSVADALIISFGQSGAEIKFEYILPSDNNNVKATLSRLLMCHWLPGVNFKEYEMSTNLTGYPGFYEQYKVAMPVKFHFEIIWVNSEKCNRIVFECDRIVSSGNFKF